MLSTTTQNQIDREWERKAEAFEWEPVRPVYEPGDVRNDAFRNSFDRLAKVAIPFFDHEYMYYSDLLWDAQACAGMDTGDVLFIILRDVGTHVFHPVRQEPDAIERKFEECIQHVDMNERYRAVLKVYRQHYDTFTVAVVYERKDRPATT